MLHSVLSAFTWMVSLTSSARSVLLISPVLPIMKLLRQGEIIKWLAWVSKACNYSDLTGTLIPEPGSWPLCGERQNNISCEGCGLWSSAAWIQIQALLLIRWTPLGKWLFCASVSSSGKPDKKIKIWESLSTKLPVLSRDQSSCSCDSQRTV